MQCIKNLKDNKSPGFDRISNEMIKCTNCLGVTLLTKLFNIVLCSGTFPLDWNYGLIKLIHKGNNRDDPNNYRGITLNSCLGKLFVPFFITVWLLFLKGKGPIPWNKGGLE